MLMFEAVVVVGVVALLVYGTIRLLAPTVEQPRAAPVGGRWRTAHYDSGGRTRVVVRRVSPSGVTVLDEHVVATIAVDDPEYDAKFLAAMTTARERRALFEAEEE
jgi:hypothetical protein